MLACKFFVVNLCFNCIHLHIMLRSLITNCGLDIFLFVLLLSLSELFDNLSFYFSSEICMLFKKNSLLNFETDEISKLILYNHALHPLLENGPFLFCENNIKLYFSINIYDLLIHPSVWELA